MSLADVIRIAAVKTARTVTLSLHVDIQHTPWTDQDEFGNMVPGPTATYKALVDQRQEEVRTPSGQIERSRYYVAILEEVPPNGAPKRTSEPFDARDIITLPGGVTGPILNIDGFLDGGTGVPFYSQIYLG